MGRWAWSIALYHANTVAGQNMLSHHIMKPQGRKILIRLQQVIYSRIPHWCWPNCLGQVTFLLGLVNKRSVWYDILKEVMKFHCGQYIPKFIVITVEYIPYNMHMVLLCFVLLWLWYQFIVDSCSVFIHILQGCFTGTWAIIQLPKCQWSNPE